MDRRSTALKVGELMDKHGSDEWLGPLLDEVRKRRMIEYIATLTCSRSVRLFNFKL